MSSIDTSAGLRLPQPEEIPERDTEDAMGAYLMMFASLAIGLPIPLFNLIASIIYFFVNRKNSVFAAFHSLQALLTHIPVVLLNAGMVGWIIGNLVVKDRLAPAFFWYLFFTILANLAYIIWSIVALVRARKGRFVYFPLIGRFCFGRYYGPGAEKRRRPKQWENKPPEGF